MAMMKRRRRRKRDDSDLEGLGMGAEFLEDDSSEQDYEDFDGDFTEELKQFSIDEDLLKVDDDAAFDIAIDTDLFADGLSAVPESKGAVKKKEEPEREVFKFEDLQEMKITSSLGALSHEEAEEEKEVKPGKKFTGEKVEAEKELLSDISIDDFDIPGKDLKDFYAEELIQEDVFDRITRMKIEKKHEVEVEKFEEPQVMEKKEEVPPEVPPMEEKAAAEEPVVEELVEEKVEEEFAIEEPVMEDKYAIGEPAFEEEAVVEEIIEEEIPEEAPPVEEHIEAAEIPEEPPAAEPVVEEPEILEPVEEKIEEEIIIEEPVMEDKYSIGEPVFEEEMEEKIEEPAVEEPVIEEIIEEKIEVEAAQEEPVAEEAEELPEKEPDFMDKEIEDLGGERVTETMSFTEEVVDDTVVVYRKARRVDDFLQEIQEAAPAPIREPEEEFPGVEPEFAGMEEIKEELPVEEALPEIQVEEESSEEIPSLEEEPVDVDVIEEIKIEEIPAEEAPVEEPAAEEIPPVEEAGAMAIEETVEEIPVIEEPLEPSVGPSKEELLEEIVEEVVEEIEETAKEEQEEEAVMIETQPPAVQVEKPAFEKEEIFKKLDNKITGELTALRGEIESVLGRMQMLEGIRGKIREDAPDLKEYIAKASKVEETPLPAVEPTVKVEEEELAEIPEVPIIPLEEEEMTVREKRVIKKEVDDLLSGIGKVTLDKEVSFLTSLVRSIPALFFLKPRMAEILGREELDYKILVGLYRIAARLMKEELGNREKELGQVRNEFQKYKQQASRLQQLMGTGAKPGLPEREVKPEEDEGRTFVLREENKKKDKIISQQETMIERLRSDFANLRGRQKKEIDLQVTKNKEEVFLSLLSVVDDFERALAFPYEDEASKNVVKGFEMIVNDLINKLKKFNLQPIPTKGNHFDPYFHEAITFEETLELPDGIIMDEIRKGYIMDDRVIRASQVKIARSPDAVTSAGEVTAAPAIPERKPVEAAPKAEMAPKPVEEKIVITKKEEESPSIEKTKEEGYTLQAFFGATYDDLKSYNGDSPESK